MNLEWRGACAIVGAEWFVTIGLMTRHLGSAVHLGGGD